MKPVPGDKAPDFSLPDQHGKPRALKEYRGRWVLLYFYPKDDTPGCTAEACAFRDSWTKAKKEGLNVIGVSADPVARHAAFAEKYGLPFTLLSDENKAMVRDYGVWAKKKFMGREYMGTLRHSFLINPAGRIAKIYDAVKPATHAAEALADLKKLKKG